MQVIIAEKPSVAREIAAIVGATNRKDGFIEGNGYAVTWAFGHLVGLAMPQQYGIAGFRRENLPILPSSFILLPRQVREGKEYMESTFVRTEIRIIEHGVRVQDAHYTYVVKVQTFRYHLRTDQYVRLSLLKIGDNLLVGSAGTGSV